MNVYELSVLNYLRDEWESVDIYAELETAKERWEHKITWIDDKAQWPEQDGLVAFGRIMNTDEARIIERIVRE